MFDLQAELDAARAIEKSLMDVHAALSELDSDGRRVVLIRALASLDVEVEEETPPGDDLCPKCEQREIAYRRKWCAVCAKDHAEKIRAGKKKAEAGAAEASDRAKKRREALSAGLCTKCSQNKSADGSRWCEACKKAYDAAHGKVEDVSATMPATECPVVSNMTATEPKDEEADIDRGIVERSIMAAVKNGPKDIFTITKAVWGTATISMQRRLKKILWAMKYDGLLRQKGELYEAA